MGNPHCVVFVNDYRVFKMSDSDFAVRGREFEHHPFFPRGVNTEFILAIAKDRLQMRVWERGSGETFACGTGACAALVAAALTQRSDRKAVVELRGGNLEIEWRDHGADSDHVFMTGDAVEVFRTRLEVGSSKILAL
jgi:diaminopimelate epimerase